jgi:hypothetical protein
MIGGPVLSLLMVLAGVFGVSFKQVLFSQGENEAKTVIENFPIPNSREDLLEFLMMASTRIKPSYGLDYAARKQRTWNDVWEAKSRHVQEKIELTFAGDAELKRVASGIREKVETARKKAKTRSIVLAAIAAVAVVVPAVLIVSALAPEPLPEFPEPRTLRAEEIRMTGVLADLLRATGGRFEARAVGDRPELVLTLDLEIIGSFGTLLNGKIQEERKNRNWPNGEPHSVASSPTSKEGFYLPVVGKGSSVPTFADVLKLEPGETVRVEITFRPTGYNPSEERIRKGRAEIITVMGREETLVRSDTIEYGVVNLTRQNLPRETRGDYQFWLKF